MRNSLFTLLCLMPFALSPNAAYAHGSSIFESADSAKAHAEHHAAPKVHVEHSINGIAEVLEDMHDDIDQLQDQLSDHDQRTRVADIVGGIGYIVGITGIAYYYLGARRRKQS